MAKKKTETDKKKRRWYRNIADAYKITARSYPWIGWLLAAIAVAILGINIVLAALKIVSWLMAIITGILLSLIIDMFVLSMYVRPAMYSQIEGKTGAVYAPISQIKRGWIVSDQPVAANAHQDVVWRLVGAPGIVPISEGPSSRVKPLLDGERRKAARAAQNVPIHLIQVGREDGQVPLPKLERHLKRLKKELVRQEVPAIAQRLNALQNKTIQAPHGVDPNKARINRKALRGK